MKDLLISPKYGVNPSLSQCFFCMEDKNEILLLGLLKYDQEAPKTACYNREPCDECRGYMEMGIICVSTRDGESGDNPWRTGQFAVIKEEAVKRMLQTKELLDDVLKSRFVFIEDTVWKTLGLPEKDQCPERGE